MISFWSNISKWLYIPVAVRLTNHLLSVLLASRLPWLIATLCFTSIKNRANKVGVNVHLCDESLLVLKGFHIRLNSSILKGFHSSQQTIPTFLYQNLQKKSFQLQLQFYPLEYINIAKRCGIMHFCCGSHTKGWFLHPVALTKYLVTGHEWGPHAVLGPL